jgi:hypothetical protein
MHASLFFQSIVEIVFTIGLALLTLGVVARAILGDLELSKTSGRPLPLRLVEAISLAFGLMIMPPLLKERYDLAAAGSAGTRIGITLVVSYLAVVGAGLAIALAATRPRGPKKSRFIEGLKEEEILSLPLAKCPRWPQVCAVLLFVAAAIGAVVGGGGTFEGCLLAFGLNPMAWGASACLALSGFAKCPHCGRFAGRFPEQPVGAPVTCISCGNHSRKAVL